MCDHVDDQESDLRWRMDSTRSMLQEENDSILSQIDMIHPQSSMSTFSLSDSRVDMHDFFPKGSILPSQLDLSCSKPVVLD